jgi:hypothetical protein
MTRLGCLCMQCVTNIGRILPPDKDILFDTLSYYQFLEEKAAAS